MYHTLGFLQRGVLRLQILLFLGSVANHLTHGYVVALDKHRLPISPYIIVVGTCGDLVSFHR